MRNRSLVETRVLTHCKCIQITRQRRLFFISAGSKQYIDDTDAYAT